MALQVALASHHSFCSLKEIPSTHTNFDYMATNQHMLCCAVPRPAAQCGVGSDCVAGEGGGGAETLGRGHHEAVQQAGPAEDRQAWAAAVGGAGG